ncbi:efflux RND transporter periplasmic adaptor subunit [Dyella flagellata]|uniref:RND transporter n=1 Tax=Dyella flagellata TaxID=1867833 RepID=A0ABQ5XGR3_9GAMM|nr:HlyD family efflux transporter periplasmic adaptor subunit [Dyella flagellata]GLQ90899.1 RND transporter [Dyella flagellata]
MDIANPALKLRKRRKTHLIGAGVTAVVLSLLLFVLRLDPALPEVDRAGLWVDTVQRGPMLREVNATGTLVPRESRWLAAATSAQVEQILVLPGAQVQPDTVLMRLSDPEVEDNLRNAQAQVAAAQADVAAKQAELNSQLLDTRAALSRAKSDYASAKVKSEAYAQANLVHAIAQVDYRQQQIVAAQFQSQVEVEQQRVDAFAASMKAQMDAVRARLAQQSSNLALRQHQADALNLKAGIVGVLQEVAVQEGAQVAAGANLARVARPDVLMARLQVPEVEAKDVTLGMPVDVDTHNGKVSGKVERIDPAVRNGSVQVDVRLTDPLPPGARPDLSVDGRILVAKLDDVLSVGRPALARSDSDLGLFRLDPASHVATRMPVRMGAASVDRVEIVHGLKAGDQVILSDTSQWDKYERIRVK